MEDIKVGQIWLDYHKRSVASYLLVEKVDEVSVKCRILNPAPITIRKNRLRPGSRGYSLVAEPEPLPTLKASYGLSREAVGKGNPAPVAAGQQCESRKTTRPTQEQRRHYLLRNYTPAKEAEYDAKVLKYWEEHPPTPDQLKRIRS